MNPLWKDRLVARCVEIRDSRVTDFGHPAAELQAAQSGTVLCDLSHLGAIRFQGDDAAVFLQAQLSCDLRRVSAMAAQYGSYCTPKGRMLALFLLWQSGGGYWMQLPLSLREPIQKRLSMFVLRSKVKITDASDAAVKLGIAGVEAQAALVRVVGSVPAEALAVRTVEDFSVMRLDARRFEIVVPPGRAPELWDALAERATPAGASVWDWLDIRAGIPSVFPATQDRFVPQMANLELIGGVSFEKGCYPGQEIVARTHYLGRLKRRMYLAQLAADMAPAPGDELFDPDGQANGMVVNAAPAPGGGYDLLAVVQVTSVEAGDVRWKSPEGPRLVFLPLPYPV